VVFFGSVWTARKGAFFEIFYPWLKFGRAKSRKTDAFVKETRVFWQKTR